MLMKHVGGGQLLYAFIQNQRSGLWTSHFCTASSVLGMRVMQGTGASRTMQTHASFGTTMAKQRSS